MQAVLLHRSRTAHGKGIVEAVVWKVPQPVPPSEYPYKYRLVYVVNGESVIGYDNERGKGDHKHIRGAEFPYDFKGPQQLMVDFLADVEGVNDE